MLLLLGIVSGSISVDICQSGSYLCTRDVVLACGLILTLQMGKVTMLRSWDLESSLTLSVFLWSHWAGQMSCPHSHPTYSLSGHLTGASRGLPTGHGGGSMGSLESPPSPISPLSGSVTLGNSLNLSFPTQAESQLHPARVSLMDESRLPKTLC